MKIKGGVKAYPLLIAVVRYPKVKTRKIRIILFICIIIMAYFLGNDYVFNRIIGLGFH